MPILYSKLNGINFREEQTKNKILTTNFGQFKKDWHRKTNQNEGAANFFLKKITLPP